MLIQPELSLGFILFCCLVVVFILQVLVYLFTYGKFAFHKTKDKSVDNLKPVSVIICAKNEEQHLIKNLPFILKQDYPEYEVIVVDDYSQDDTKVILEDYERKYPHMRIITVKEDRPYKIGKKFPLTLGIKGAKYDTVVLTDADCVPASDQWLKQISSNFKDKIEIVLGYGAYEKLPGFLNKLIRFDTFVIAMQYFSFALKGKTYMGVGRNLAYKTNLFFKNKGFANHTHIASGDDDLFIHRVAKSDNVAIEYAHTSHTISAAKKSFTEWAWQKKRHLTTAPLYRKSVKLFLGYVYLLPVLFYLILTLLVVLNYALYILLGLFLLRIIVQLVVFRKAMIKLNEKDLLLYAPILEILFIFIQPYLYVSSKLTKNLPWN
jgi:cellulose synthase/poly-beta-1,6-N-acetylglucosamine synthase-like glycosyltransferase